MEKPELLRCDLDEVEQLLIDELGLPCPELRTGAHDDFAPWPEDLLPGLDGLPSEMFVTSKTANTTKIDVSFFAFILAPFTFADGNPYVLSL